LPVVRPSNEDEDEGKRLSYRMTTQQKACIERIEAIVGFDEEKDSEEDWLAEMDSDDSSDENRLDE
jgi:hypothetical protein